MLRRKHGLQALEQLFQRNAEAGCNLFNICEREVSLTQLDISQIHMMYTQEIRALAL